MSEEQYQTIPIGLVQNIIVQNISDVNRVLGLSDTTFIINQAFSQVYPNGDYYVYLTSNNNKKYTVVIDSKYQVINGTHTHIIPGSL